MKKSIILIVILYLTIFFLSFSASLQAMAVGLPEKYTEIFPSLTDFNNLETSNETASSSNSQKVEDEKPPTLDDVREENYFCKIQGKQNIQPTLDYLSDLYKKHRIIPINMEITKVSESSDLFNCEMRLFGRKADFILLLKELRPKK